MNTYEKIQNDINDVKEWNQEAGSMLHAQMHAAQNSERTREELEDLLKSDDDVADKFYSEDDPRHNDIRTIQDAIIGFYGY